MEGLTTRSRRDARNASVMRKKTIAVWLSLSLLGACSMQAKLDSSMAEPLCRDAFGVEEANWSRLSGVPPQAQKLLRAAATGPEGRIAADMWFQDSQNGVGICELRNRRFNFARVFVVRSAGEQWTLQRVYGSPKIEVPEIDEPEHKPPPESTPITPSGA
jgi:hypothetical protein